MVVMVVVVVLTVVKMEVLVVVMAVNARGKPTRRMQISACVIAYLCRSEIERNVLYTKDPILSLFLSPPLSLYI